MAKLEKDELLKLLESLYDKLAEHKMLPPGSKKEVIHYLADFITKNDIELDLSKKNLHQTLQTLAIAIVHPSLGLTLLERQKNPTPAELTMKLSMALKEFSEKNPKFKITPDEINTLIKDIVEQHMKGPAGEDQLAQNADTPEKIMKMYLKSVFGPEYPALEEKASTFFLTFNEDVVEKAHLISDNAPQEHQPRTPFSTKPTPPGTIS
ncbi:MAG: hypothetical protein EPO11_05735 [Gammaproteobacteria bacterium]|nr:MAG: hypothetical protein EPO11_05735 [Gammaproteobacteria bacterium]